MMLTDTKVKVLLLSCRFCQATSTLL